ncbi:bacterioferritin [Pseudomonas duriflava]|uniref:Bacterioferritin n=1 Tax=Pseudomonas duriflava TaxID=459528 RepID=A0A562QDF9_9PSED|nr:bacterioferritin [Pseudomonas duriflava]TWI54805.1 bacterioferritin [Pseudomonas duriflava]
MKGHTQVIDYLKDLLRGELAARDQYFIHSRMYADWGYWRLYERINHEMEEETQHADALLRRILFLEGQPDMRPKDIDIGHTVPDMLRSDLALEYEVREALAKGVALCNQLEDFVSREILVAQLEDTEEDHAYWLEQQLGLIDKMGLENYLQSQMKAGPAIEQA